MHFPMHFGGVLAVSLICATGVAQVTVSGRVVDETGAGVASVRMELQAGLYEVSY
jgi:hypothetical protein